MNLCAAIVPYLAVFLGMTLLRSAWMAILLYHLGVLVFLYTRGTAGLFDKIRGGLRHPLTIPATLTCALAAPVVYFLWPWLANPGVVLREWLAGYGLTGGSWIALVFYFALVHPIFEEVHWRSIAPKTAPFFWWGDAVFAGYHLLVLHELIAWPWLIFVFAILTGASMFWRWTAARSGGWAIAILSHAAADAGVVIAVCWLLKGGAS